MLLLTNGRLLHHRAAEILKCFNDVKRMEESQQLSMFLGTHNCILTTMKTAFQQVTGFQDILCEIVNICIHTYENNLYLTPAEKHSLVKVREVTNEQNNIHEFLEAV